MKMGNVSILFVLTVFILQATQYSVYTTPVPSQPSATSPSSSSFDEDYATDSCYSPISTSADWFQLSGAWESPCVSDSSVSMEATDMEDLWSMFFMTPSLDTLASYVIATLKESRDIAITLRTEILAVNMHGSVAVAEFLDNHTLIPGVGNNANDTDTTQKVEAQYRKISTALVYLEQCGHDELPLCGRRRNLVTYYDDLQHKLLSGLCQMTDIFHGLSAAMPAPVARSVMPESQRTLVNVTEPQRKRNYRDYVVLSDVSKILLEAISVFSEIDW